MKVYAFMYNDCVHESAWSTMSLHKSREGAESALNEHKGSKRVEWQSIVDSDEDKGTPLGFDVLCPFGIHQGWDVEDFELLQ